MISPNSPIVGTGGDAEEALSYAFLHGADRYDDVVAYFEELDRLCELVGFDVRILAAQAWHETAGFASRWWTERLNPAGIGITGDPAQNAVSHTWATGTEAARAHVVHMLAYVDRDLPHIKEITDLIDSGIDPRWDAVVEANLERSVRTLGDLGNGKWATDPDYAEQIAAVANRIFTEVTPMTVTKPVIHDLATDYALYGLEKWEADIIISKCIWNRLGYSPQGIVFHIQDGSTRGSLTYWVGVQASSTVMINKDGTILNIIPRQHGPWTNGDVQNPNDRGWHLVNLGGGDPNRVSITCEMEGRPGDALTPEQENAAIWWALDVMREFPHIGMDDIYQHADINSVTRPNCADGYYPGLVQKIAEANTTPAPTPVPKPTINWVRGDVGIGTFKDAKVLKMVGRAVIIADTTARYGASAKSKAFKRYPKDTKVVVVGTFNSGWAVIDAGDGAFPRIAMRRLDPTYPIPADLDGVLDD